MSTSECFSRIGLCSVGETEAKCFHFSSVRPTFGKMAGRMEDTWVKVSMVKYIKKKKGKIKDSVNVKNKIKHKECSGIM